MPAGQKTKPICYCRPALRGVFQRPPGGLAAGVVAVEGENDGNDLAAASARVGVVAVPSVATALPTPFRARGDDVHVAFGDDGGVGFAQRWKWPAGRPNSSRALRRGGFRRVQVFRLALSMMPPKAMIPPFGLTMGTISRSRKRS